MSPTQPQTSARWRSSFCTRAWRLPKAKTPIASPSCATQGGLSRYLDVLTAEDTLVTLKRQVADLEAQAFAQDVALVRALGGGFVVKC